jgi:hypothetical protein
VYEIWLKNCKYRIIFILKNANKMMVEITSALSAIGSQYCMPAKQNVAEEYNQQSVREFYLLSLAGLSIQMRMFEVKLEL